MPLIEGRVYLAFTVQIGFSSWWVNKKQAWQQEQGTNRKYGDHMIIIIINRKQRAFR